MMTEFQIVNCPFLDNNVHDKCSLSCLYINYLDMIDIKLLSCVIQVP